MIRSQANQTPKKKSKKSKNQRNSINITKKDNITSNSTPASAVKEGENLEESFQSDCSTSNLELPPLERVDTPTRTNPEEITSPENDSAPSPSSSSSNASSLLSLSARRIIIPSHKAYYLLYLLVAVFVMNAFSPADFVRSLYIHTNTNSQNPNTLNNKTNGDVHEFDQHSAESGFQSIVAHHEVAEVIIASNSGASLTEELTTRTSTGTDLVRFGEPSNNQNAIQLVTAQFRNSIKIFVNKVSSLFQNMVYFFLPFTRPRSQVTSTIETSQSALPSANSQAVAITSEYAGLVWAGKPVTLKEIEELKQLRSLLNSNKNKLKSQWGKSIQPVELLRFLRAKHHHVQQALKALLHHDQFRISEFGPESSFMWTSYDNSPLLMEGFWLDYNKEGCPTLVIRTQLHDGYYYNDDPKIYAAYLVRLLEEGRERFKIGIDHQVCVLMDRAGAVWKNGRRKVDKLDMSVIPGLVQLFRHVYSTLTENYPDVLHSCKIAPASKFFSLCYKVTSRVMAQQHRDKFQMLEAEELPSKLHTWIDKKNLPAHLGGQSLLPNYQSETRIEFDPYASKFPINSKKRRKQVVEDSDWYHENEKNRK